MAMTTDLKTPVGMGIEFDYDINFWNPLESYFEI